MRISDWSSDVCSSDPKIVGVEAEDQLARPPLPLALHLDGTEGHVLDRDGKLFGRGDEDVAAVGLAAQDGREEPDHRRAIDATALMIPTAVDRKSTRLNSSH